MKKNEYGLVWIERNEGLCEIQATDQYEAAKIAGKIIEKWGFEGTFYVFRMMEEEGSKHKTISIEIGHYHEYDYEEGDRDDELLTRTRRKQK